MTKSTALKTPPSSKALSNARVLSKIHKVHNLHKSRYTLLSLRGPLMESNEVRRVRRLLHQCDTKSRLFRCLIKICSNCSSVPTTYSAHASCVRLARKTVLANRIEVIYSCSGLYEGPSDSLACYTGLSSHSSPHSSFGSISYSSRTSSATQSPPSSQASIADLASTSPLPFIRPQPRIQVSSLLADPHTRTYHLEIVQHPVRTAEFGAAYLSRVPLTPPIIARLTVRDPSGNSVVPEAELPFLIAHLSLFTGDGSTPLDMGSYIGRGVNQHPPILYGHLVSTVEQLEDLQGNMGLFFLFPDVSIRSRGQFQLGVTLTRITSPDPSGLVEHGTSLAQTRTRAFDAVALHDYIAAPPTRLTQSFIRQGARMFANMPYPPTR